MLVFSLLKPSRYSGKKKDSPVIATIANDNNQQVKTYMDTSNGVRSSNPNAYNKVCFIMLLQLFFFIVSLYVSGIPMSLDVSGIPNWDSQCP